jgi:hypothetical protein
LRPGSYTLTIGPERNLTGVKEGKRDLVPVVERPAAGSLFVNLGIDHRIRNDRLPDDRKERVFADVWDHHGVDLAATLEDPEDGDLAGCATPAFAFANAAKIAFVHLRQALRPASRRFKDGLF